MAAAADRHRVRVRVEGIVQGVGFRPFVHRLAAELGVSGYVLNDERGVVVEAEAAAATLERFLQRLPEMLRRWQSSNASAAARWRSPGPVAS